MVVLDVLEQPANPVLGRISLPKGLRALEGVGQPIDPDNLPTQRRQEDSVPTAATGDVERVAGCTGGGKGLGERIRSPEAAPFRLWGELEDLHESWLATEAGEDLHRPRETVDLGNAEGLALLGQFLNSRVDLGCWNPDRAAKWGLRSLSRIEQVEERDHASRSRSADSSGSVSLMNVPIADSTPARYLSLSAVLKGG